MQGMSKAALAMASNEIRKALACVGRHTGPGTTSISLKTQAVNNSLDNDFAWPETVTGSSILANMVCLELELHDYEEGQDDADVLRFTMLLLQKVPNLTAARLWYYAFPPACIRPLPQLKHLDMGLKCMAALDGVRLGVFLPALETACITTEAWDAIAELNVSGCQHLTWLVLVGVQVCRVLKPPQCRLRMDLWCWDEDVVEASRLQPALTEVHEASLYNQDFYREPEGLLAHVSMPKLEVIRCNWVDDDSTDNSGATNALIHCLRHIKKLPAVKSILVGDYSNSDGQVMKARIPADLGGIQELMFATERPLQLFFHNACNAGERLNSFCAVAREVRADADALLDLNDAPFRRGLTLSLARAGQEHGDAPSQCVYMRALSAPHLSYEEAIGQINLRVAKWGNYHDSCAQCGACFKCLREAGTLDCN